MAMIYDYLTTMFEVLVRLIEPKTLVMISLIAISLFVLWVVLQLLFSFQRKFSTKCIKLYNSIKKNMNYTNNMEFVDNKIRKISVGFARGWNKFKNGGYRKPSDCIKRYEALDVEIHGGVLNQGKSIMKSYIYVVTAVVLLFNVAYLGGKNELTFNLIAQALLLPAITLLILKIFYYTYTSIRHSMYKADVDCFYELIDILDECYGKSEPEYVLNSQPVQVVSNGQEEVSVEEQNEEVKETDSVEVDNQEEQIAEQQVEEEKKEPVNVKKSIDEFDVFKKKNIDVDKLINEIPNSANSLPYINVDSDYVIKDDENSSGNNFRKLNRDNGESGVLFGGIMHNLSNVKNDENSENQNSDSKDSEQESSSKIENEAVSENENDKDVENENVEDKVENLENYDDILEEETSKSHENVEDEENKIEETEPEKEKIELDETIENEDSSLSINDVQEEMQEATFEESSISDEKVDDESENEEDEIASIVGKFKSNKKGLAGGKVVIEKNNAPKIEDNSVNNYVEPEPTYETSQVQTLDANNDADSILNSFRNSAGYDNFGGYGNMNEMYNGNYGSPNYNQGYNQTGYGYQNNGYVDPSQNYGQQFYNQNAGFGTYDAGLNGQYSNVNQNMYNQNYNEYNPNYNDVNVTVEPEQEASNHVKQKNKPVNKKVKEQKVEPKKVSAKKTETKKVEEKPKKKEERQVEENVTSAKTRGRPKSQVVDEELEIKDDKQFNEVLSRAEKLMRKSEEGLSQSQSKRIEKELKILMDAMNRYRGK